MHVLKLSWLPLSVRSPSAAELSRQVFWMSMLGGPLPFAMDGTVAPSTMAAVARAIVDLISMAYLLFGRLYVAFGAGAAPRGAVEPAPNILGSCGLNGFILSFGATWLHLPQ